MEHLITQRCVLSSDFDLRTIARVKMFISRPDILSEIQLIQNGTAAVASRQAGTIGHLTATPVSSWPRLFSRFFLCSLAIRHCGVLLSDFQRSLSPFNQFIGKVCKERA